MTYTDVLHVYGLSRAGYIPQLFSIRLPSPVVIFELLQRAKAKALIFDSSFKSVLENCPVPTHLAVRADSVTDTADPLPDMPKAISGDEIVFVFHTSGSTSGSPKLVPCSRKWLNMIVCKAKQTSRPRVSERQDVSTWM
jgi:acyl-CoA synthetase (AMP-forming)/AMP-acid ligase II